MSDACTSCRFVQLLQSYMAYIVTRRVGGTCMARTGARRRSGRSRRTALRGARSSPRERMYIISSTTTSFIIIIISTISSSSSSSSSNSSDIIVIIIIIIISITPGAAGAAAQHLLQHAQLHLRRGVYIYIYI